MVNYARTALHNTWLGLGITVTDTAIDSCAGDTFLILLVVSRPILGARSR